MSKYLSVEMVTPEKVALKASAERVVLPAFGGEMGVLPGHEQFMAQLVAGEVRIREGGEMKSFAISGGFAEILNNKISIFAETAEMSEEIDDERAAQALERAKREVKTGDRGGDLTLEQAEAAFKRATVRLRLSKIRRRTPGASRAPRPGETDL